jgi:predicted lipid-binding transport protein (Tim44 family)
MIDNPENGHNPEMRDKEADPAQSVQTATVVAEPGAQTTQPSPSSPGMSPQTLTPMTEPAPTAPTAGNQSVAVAEPLPAATEPVSETDFSSELTKFRQSFEEIQAEFIGEPRAAVEKAETLIDGLMNALHDQLQRIHSNVKTETDTEQLRVAMLSYRELFDSLGGHRPA